MWSSNIITSLSTRRVWIEIDAEPVIKEVDSKSLSTRRVWIEILLTETLTATREESHSPHGECGLKYHNIKTFGTHVMVTLHTESVD